MIVHTSPVFTEGPWSVPSTSWLNRRRSRESPFSTTATRCPSRKTGTGTVCGKGIGSLLVGDCRGRASVSGLNLLLTATTTRVMMDRISGSLAMYQTPVIKRRISVNLRNRRRRGRRGRNLSKSSAASSKSSSFSSRLVCRAKKRGARGKRRESVWNNVVTVTRSLLRGAEHPRMTAPSPCRWSRVVFAVVLTLCWSTTMRWPVSLSFCLRNVKP